MYFCGGEMAEWSIAAVLKTVEGYTSGGSNPSFSAKTKNPALSGIFLLTFISQNQSQLPKNYWTSFFRLFESLFLRQNQKSHVEWVFFLIQFWFYFQTNPCYIKINERHFFDCSNPSFSAKTKNPALSGIFFWYLFLKSIPVT